MLLGSRMVIDLSASIRVLCQRIGERQHKFPEKIMGVVGFYVAGGLLDFTNEALSV